MIELAKLYLAAPQYLEWGMVHLVFLIQISSDFRKSVVELKKNNVRAASYVLFGGKLRTAAQEQHLR